MAKRKGSSKKAATKPSKSAAEDTGLPQPSPQSSSQTGAEGGAGTTPQPNTTGAPPAAGASTVQIDAGMYKPVEADYGVEEPEEARTPQQKQKEQEDEQQVATEEAQEDEAVFDADLVDRAEDYGLDPADFASNEALERVVKRVEKAQRRPQPQPQANQQQTQTPPSEGEEEEFRLELDEDYVDPSIVKALKSAHQYSQKKIKTLEDQLKAQQEQIAQRDQMELQQRFEGYCADAAEEVGDLLGDGNLAEMNEGSMKFDNCIKVLQEMNRDAAGFQAVGMRPPSEKRLFKRAINTVFGEQLKTKKSRKVSNQLQRRSRQHMSRPIQRDTTQPVDRTEKAVTNLQRRLAEKGFGPLNGEDVEF